MDTGSSCAHLAKPDEKDVNHSGGDELMIGENGKDFNVEEYSDEKHLESCSRLSGCIFPTRCQVISTPIPGQNHKIKQILTDTREEK